MLLTHLIHLILSGLTILHFCEQFDSVAAFVQQANELEKAGMVALAYIFIVTLWSILLELWRGKL